MAITSPEVKAALETIFAADSEFYRARGFQRRIGYGARPALSDPPQGLHESS